MRVTINFVALEDVEEVADQLKDEQHLRMGCGCGQCVAYRQLVERIAEAKARAAA